MFCYIMLHTLVELHTTHPLCEPWILKRQSLVSGRLFLQKMNQWNFYCCTLIFQVAESFQQGSTLTVGREYIATSIQIHHIDKQVDSFVPD